MDTHSPTNAKVKHFVFMIHHDNCNIHPWESTQKHNNWSKHNTLYRAVSICNHYENSFASEMFF